jgi:hypothetical protein
MSSVKVNIWLQNESWGYTVDAYEKQRRINKGTLMNSSVHVRVTVLMWRFNMYSVFYEYGMILTTFQLCLKPNKYPVLTAICHYSQNQKPWQSQDSPTTWVLLSLSYHLFPRSGTSHKHARYTNLQCKILQTFYKNRIIHIKNSSTE